VFQKAIKAMSTKKISIPRNKITDFCRRHKIRKLSLFGSVLRDDFRADSDIDVLVEFEPTNVPGFFRLLAMQEELSDLLGGRKKVDLRTPEDLSRYFCNEIMVNAEVQYAQ
jgi:uncharacterized protein